MHIHELCFTFVEVKAAFDHLCFKTPKPPDNPEFKKIENIVKVELFPFGLSQVDINTLWSEP